MSVVKNMSSPPDDDVAMTVSSMLLMEGEGLMKEDGIREVDDGDSTDGVIGTGEGESSKVGVTIVTERVSSEVGIGDSLTSELDTERDGSTS